MRKACGAVLRRDPTVLIYLHQSACVYADDLAAACMSHTDLAPKIAQASDLTPLSRSL